MDITKSDTFRRLFKCYHNDCRFTSGCPVLETFAHLYYNVRPSSNFTAFVTELHVFLRSLWLLGKLQSFDIHTQSVNQDLVLWCKNCDRKEAFENIIIYLEEEEVLSLIFDN